MTIAAARIVLVAVAFLSVRAGAAELSEQMRSAFPDAIYPSSYSSEERTAALRAWLGRDPPRGITVVASLTPNAPYATNGARLSVWKPSFVLGTKAGGEIGINFWGILNEGHVNVGFARAADAEYILDCRVLAPTGADYKIHAGTGSTPWQERHVMPNAGHMFIDVPAGADAAVSVEIWPTPTNATFGFLGCDLLATN